MGSLDRPSKHQAFLALLQEGWTSLHLDARREGVVVPAHLKTEAHLVLQYGNDLPIPITDLVVDDQGVSATLSFSRTPHRTVVPWTAVYVIATDDGRGVLYHEDVPGDVAVIAAKGDGEHPTVGDGGLTPPNLLAVAEASSEALPPAPAPVPPRRTLRSIPLEGAGAVVEPPPSPAADSGEIDASAIPAPRRRRKPQLRLVK